MDVKKRVRTRPWREVRRQGTPEQEAEIAEWVKEQVRKIRRRQKAAKGKA